MLSKLGYWKGDLTCKKVDYDTHENSGLVFLNDLLLKKVDYDKNYSVFVNPEKVIEVEQLFYKINLEPFKEFVDNCEQSGPWIWKDPRLWVTFPFWVHLLAKDSFHVVFVDRSISQRWISELLRRNVQTIDYCKQYNFQVEKIIKNFITHYNLNCYDVFFDDLIQYPEVNLAKCNLFFEGDLTVENLQAIYNKPLYKKTHAKKNLFLAVIIFLMNYRERLKKYNEG